MCLTNVFLCVFMNFRQESRVTFQVTGRIANFYIFACKHLKTVKYLIFLTLPYDMNPIKSNQSV